MTVTDEPIGIEKLQRIAAAVGWQCLSDKWVGYHARYWFACPNGHRIERSASPPLYRDSPRIVCAICEAESLRDRWLSIVTERGRKLLDGPFTGLQRWYRLQCGDGNISHGTAVFETHRCR